LPQVAARARGHVRAEAESEVESESESEVEDCDTACGEKEKLKSLGGAYPDVLMTASQSKELSERLSADELGHYLDVIERQLQKGHHYAKSHYQAILDMAERDRRAGQRVKDVSRKQQVALGKTPSFDIAEIERRARENDPVL